MILKNIHKKLGKADLLALLVCVGVFLLWLNLLIEKFVYFGYYDWDLAIYANAMWALTHGSFSGSLWGTNFLTNHAEYISLFIVPIYWLFPSALTLITLKVLSLVAGGFVLYLIGKEKIGWLFSLLLMLFYFAFPANYFMLIFEFHFESLAIVFLFLVYYYLYVRVDFKKFILCCILASLCKENIPPVIFMFGFMNLFQKKNINQKFAWIAMAIGAGIFIVGMFVITPILRHSSGMTSLTNPYIGLYWSGQEKFSFVQNLTINAQRLLTVLLSNQNTTYTKDMLLPFLFMPLLGFKTLLIALPLFLQALLSSTASLHTIYYHYAATLTPFLFLAALEGILVLRTLFSKPTVLFLSLLMIICLSANSYLQATHKFKDKTAWKDSSDPTRWALIEQIPANASVVSTFDFLSHLANRDNVYPLRNIWNNANAFKYSNFFIIPQSQYALIDWNCRWLAGEVLAAKRETAQKKLTHLKDFYFNNHWQVKASVGEITLLEKRHTNAINQKSLVEVQKKPFTFTVINGQNNVSISNKFQLLNTEIHQNSFTNFNAPLTALTFYWKANEKISDFYIMNIGLIGKSKILKIMGHHIGYAVYATPLWEQGDYIKETYWFDTSSLPMGEYAVMIAIKNLSQAQWEDITYQTYNVAQLQIATINIQSKKGELANEK